MSIEQIILKYENDFFSKEFCEKIQNLDSRIHDGFVEFGKSGIMFDKGSIIDYLSHLVTDRKIVILDFRIKYLKDDIVMANYITYEKEISTKALRTSIWINDDCDWKLIFHQGTTTEINSF